MIFARALVKDAKGAVLARSVACLKTGLRKGIVLEQSHINILLEAGQKTVSVARLEPNDIDEIKLPQSWRQLWHPIWRLMD